VSLRALGWFRGGSCPDPARFLARAFGVQLAVAPAAEPTEPARPPAGSRAAQQARPGPVAPPGREPQTGPKGISTGPVSGWLSLEPQKFKYSSVYLDLSDARSLEPQMHHSLRTATRGGKQPRSARGAAALLASKRTDQEVREGQKAREAGIA
jgi:hypothetical protein